MPRRTRIDDPRGALMNFGREATMFGVVLRFVEPIGSRERSAAIIERYT